MKKILFFFMLFFLTTSSVFAGHKLETGAKETAQRFEFSQRNLHKEITRKEFVETLYAWYDDYRKERGLYVNYEKYSKLDNEKYFTDVKLDSDFGKKLQYFAHLGAFSKNKKFHGNETVDQKTFFIVMSRLRIMWNLQHCKNLRICEKEADAKTYFTKGVYYRYVSKIFDKKLRKYYSTPQQYIDVGYKPFLSPSYYFPIKGQTLNGCYAFSVRNTLKYKHGIWIYIPKIEKHIWKKGKELWNSRNMAQFNKVTHVEAREYWSLDTVINSLQAGEPVSIVYWWHYTDWKTKEKKKVKHIVAAYSFDEKGIWVAETISARRMRISYDEIFNQYGTSKVGRVFKYYYNPKENWSEQQRRFEQENNFLAWEK